LSEVSEGEVGMTYIIGLTGSIATGKSTVVGIFQKNNIPVIDADLLTRELQEKGSPLLEVLASEFGSDILLENGELNRDKLGGRIFSSEEKREKLNHLFEPFFKELLKNRMDEFTKKHTKLLVVDIPLLFEADYTSLFDETMLVYTDEKTQLGRLMQRNNLTKEQALQRMYAQWDIERKKELADTIIDNSGTLENTEKQILNWIKTGGFI